MVVRSDFCIENQIDNEQEAIELYCDNNIDKSSRNNAVSDDEYDELFNKMEVISNKREEFIKKRKRIKPMQDEQSSIDGDVSRYLLAVTITYYYTFIIFSLFPPI